MRSYKLYMDDILKAIIKIEKYKKELISKKSKKDLVIDAIARNLEIIGEAAKNIPNHIKKKYPAIEWKKICGLRDILIHQYFGIDLEIFWDIVDNKLTDLKKKISKIK